MPADPVLLDCLHRCSVPDMPSSGNSGSCMDPKVSGFAMVVVAAWLVALLSSSVSSQSLECTAPGPSVALGASHTCVVQDDADRTGMCWGLNRFGQLGDNTRITRPTPGPLLGLAGIHAIVAGDDHSTSALSMQALCSTAGGGTTMVKLGTVQQPLV